MPLLLVDKSNIDFHFAIWKNTESISFYLDRLNFENFNINEISNQLPKKLLEWLSTRYLLSLIMEEDSYFCKKDIYGKPQLINSDKFISFSHSGIWSAFIISKYNVGIDIQKFDNKILNIKNRVFSQNDLDQIGSDENINSLIKIWTLKEAGYKAYGKKEIGFKNNIFLGTDNTINVIDKNNKKYLYQSKSIEFQNFCLSIAYQKNIN